MKIPTLYLDTSVIGGCFDDEWKDATLELFRQASLGAQVQVVQVGSASEFRSRRGAVEVSADWEMPVVGTAKFGHRPVNEQARRNRRGRRRTVTGAEQELILLLAARLSTPIFLLKEPN